MRVIGTDEIGGPATSHLAMTTYVLIHGAASDSWYWHLVVPQLRARGHDVVAPDLPPGDWWAKTGWEQARRQLLERDGRSIEDFDVMADFFHDVPPDVVAEALARGERDQSGTPMAKPWPLEAWPDVPTRFLLCRDDRFFPAEFLRRVVRERLGITPDEIDGGHLPALSRPKEFVERLEAYRTGL